MGRKQRAKNAANHSTRHPFFTKFGNQMDNTPLVSICRSMGLSFRNDLTQCFRHDSSQSQQTQTGFDSKYRQNPGPIIQFHFPAQSHAPSIQLNQKYIIINSPLSLSPLTLFSFSPVLSSSQPLCNLIASTHPFSFSPFCPFHFFTVSSTRYYIATLTPLFLLLFIYFLKFLFGDCALRLGFEMEAKNKVKIDDSTAESPTSVLEDEVCSSVPLFLPRTMISVFEE